MQGLPLSTHLDSGDFVARKGELHRPLCIMARDCIRWFRNDPVEQLPSNRGPLGPIPRHRGGEIPDSFAIPLENLLATPQSRDRNAFSKII